MSIRLKQSIVKCMVAGVLLISHAALGAVPAHYTPVRASSSEFKCLGRVTRMGSMLLPSQIWAAGESLLASPISLSAGTSQALQNLKGKGRVIDKRGDIAHWEWDGESNAFRIKVKMNGECDGFCWYEIALTPKQPVELDTLQLQIPRRTQTALYLHAANYGWGGQNGAEQTSTALAELGGKWTSAFMPYVWLGDDARGLGWTCESEQGWSLIDPTKAFRVSTDKNTTLFTTTVIDHRRTIDSPIVLKFGLQATPVKPTSPEFRANARIYHGIEYADYLPDKDGKILLDTLKDAGVKTVVFHDHWTDFFGKMTTPWGDKLKALTDACHQRGMKIIVYVGYGLAKNSEEIKGHHDNWSVIPLIPWTSDYRPYYRAFDATCARSGWSDWLVDGVDKLFTDYPLDGLYFDGTSEAWRCQNTLHGCGWKDEKGELHGEYPVLAVRDLMRRIADTVHKHRKDAILDVHMSASLTEPTLSFCDSYWDGEQYESLTPADHVTIPLSTFRSEFMGYAHGLDAEFLCYENRPFTLTEAIATAWLHGVEVRPGNMKQLVQPSQIWRAYDKFGTTKAKWMPYWADSGVTSEIPSVKASTYVKRDAALLFVSHLERTPLTTTVRLDRSRLGLLPGDLSAVNAITGESIPVTGDTLSVSFDGMTYRLIEVRDQ